MTVQTQGPSGEQAFLATLGPGNSSVAVTFPFAFPSGVTPIVVVTAQYSTSLWVTSITNTGFTLNVGSTNGYSQNFGVVAYP